MAETLRMDEKERQAKISSLLHSTEAAIKKGDLEDGLEKVRAVYAYDSRNLYAHAFEERINSLIATRTVKSGSSAAPLPAPPSSQPPPVAETQTEAATASPQQDYPDIDAIRSMFDMERAKWEEEKSFIIDRERMKTKERLLEAYRAFVTLMDVSIPKEQLDMLLLSLRGILDVTEDEHAEIIRSVQLNAYTDTLRGIWQKGSVAAEEEMLLRRLRMLYGISEEEHLRLTRQVKTKLGIADIAGGILAVDDSHDILVFIEYVLRKSYSNVRTAGSVHEASEELRRETPALIICDVMMPEIGGFAFYDMIKRGEFGEEMKKVPFVFMSVSSDGYMKKVAGELGARMYLTKPFSRDVLERTVKEMLHL